MKKVYGYIRVSTVKQGEGVSLIEQKDAISRYASQYNLSIVQWFEEKETAAKQGRPLFTAMMKLLRTKKADGVIIHKIDRGARNLKDWSDLGSLIDQGVEVHFAHESLDLQARGGRLSADIQAVIAADYIRNLRQEAIKGLYGRLKQGIYPFQAPVGYLDNGKGKFKTIDPVQGPIVKKAFELYATRKHTLHTLLEHTYKLGLRNLKGNKLQVNSLSLILNNPFYVGVIKVKDATFAGGHEPLIPPHLYKCVQAVLRNNTNQKVLKHDLQYRKMLSCKVCKHSLTGETQKGHIYYRCHTKGCITKGIRETHIENALLKVFETVQLYPKESATINSFFEEAQIEWQTSQQELLAAIKMELGKMQQRLERLTDCYVEGGLDRDTYEHRKKNLLLELKEKEAAEKQLSGREERIIKKTKQFFELAKSLKNSYEIAIPDEKRELVETMTSNLVVEGKKLLITMQLPFWDLSQRWFLNFGAPELDTVRIKGSRIGKTVNTTLVNSITLKKDNNVVVYSDINTSPIIGEPLSKEKLKQLFNLIMEHVSELPEISDES